MEACFAMMLCQIIKCHFDVADNDADAEWPLRVKVIVRHFWENRGWSSDVISPRTYATTLPSKHSVFKSLNMTLNFLNVLVLKIKNFFYHSFPPFLLIFSSYNIRYKQITIPKSMLFLLPYYLYQNVIKKKCHTKHYFSYNNQFAL